MPEFIEICEQAARAGAKELMAWRDRFQAREKGPKDLVTEADLASQEAIQQIVESAFPEHRFLGEEDGLPADLRSTFEGYCWVVDPLDGTTNYVHQLPAFAVSVALCRDGNPIAGVIYNPIVDECFSAERGAGASLNGSPIRSSNEVNLTQSLVAASFSTSVQRGSDEIERFVRVLIECRGLRRPRIGRAESGLCGEWPAGRLLGDQCETLGRGRRLADCPRSGSGHAAYSRRRGAIARPPFRRGGGQQDCWKTSESG